MLINRKINLLLLLLLILFAIMNILLFENVLNTTEKYRIFLSESLIQEQVEELLNNKSKWTWLVYTILVLIILLKIVFVSFTLFVGTFLFNIKIKYKFLFTICLKAEFIFILVGFIKFFWFLLQEDYSYEDFQYFYPLSGLSIVGYEGTSPWFIYPLQVVNLFELIYWLLLAYLLRKELNNKIDKSLKIVASSYGSALIIWVVAVMFFTLNAS